MRKTSLGLLAALCLSAPIAAQVAAPRSVGPVENLGAYAIQALDLPLDATQPFQAQVRFEGRLWTLDLAPHDVRADGFQVLVDGGDGELLPIEAPPTTTARGRVLDEQGQPLEHGQVTAGLALHGWRLTAELDATGDLLIVQPLAEMAPQLTAAETEGQYVVFRSTDALPEGDFTCGTDESLPGDDHAGPHGSDRGGATTGRRLGELAFDCDVEYFNINGGSVSNTVADVESIVNAMSFVYERDVDVQWEISTVIVRTGSTGSDPYTQFGASAMLNEFQDHWNANLDVVHRDLAHFMTGKNISGSTIGIAYLRQSCNGSSYGVSQTRFTTNFNSRVALTAHEVGHNMNSMHCNGCSSGDQQCRIMCSGLGGCNGINPLKFGSCARAAIGPYANTSACIIDEPVARPIPYHEPFELGQTSNLGDAWDYNRIAWVMPEGTNRPSGDYALKLNAVGTADYLRDDVRSHAFALAGESGLRLSFFTQDRDVDAGEELVVEYKADTDGTEWSELARLASDGVNQSEFDFHAFPLPADAYHDDFRLRFRVETDLVDDTWFIDDLHLADAPTLLQTPWVRGGVVTSEIYGFAPGEFVSLNYSVLGPGAGPCIFGGAVCFDILAPTEYGPVFTTDPDGVARLDTPLPAALPLIPIYSQALLVRFPLSGSVLSNVVTRVIQ